ncbi:MAG: LysR family transcriptional regulator [Oscillospiraceae bacterium]|nr:LysR family transcriptional regulator [Oscillospiraceae bacterium]
MLVSMELYRSFCEVATTGNVTRAAEKLFISQSAVSQAIKQLEDKLETRLFDRSARGMSLTPEGKTLFSYVSNAVNLIENAQEKLTKMKSLSEGSIKIGASDTICSVLLLNLLKSFKNDHPDIHITVLDTSTKQSLELVKNGTVDLSFVTLPTIEDAAIEIITIMPIHDCFIVGEKYEHLTNTVLNLSDLRDYPILMVESTSNSRKQIDRFLAQHGIEIEPAIEFASLGLMPKFAKEGLGIAATIKEDVPEMLENGELFELQFKEQLPVRHIALAQIKNVTLSPAAQAFKNAVLRV